MTLKCIIREMEELEKKLQQLKNLAALGHHALHGHEPVHVFSVFGGVRFDYLMTVQAALKVLEDPIGLEPLLYMRPNRLVAYDTALEDAKRNTLPDDEVIDPASDCIWYVDAAVEYRDDNLSREQNTRLVLRAEGGIEHHIHLSFPNGYPAPLQVHKGTRKVSAAGSRRSWTRPERVQLGITRHLPPSLYQRIDWWTADPATWNVSVIASAGYMRKALADVLGSLAE